jgi:hypothetical protein
MGLRIRLRCCARRQARSTASRVIGTSARWLGTSQWAKKLRDPAFSRQFVDLTLQDFMTYDPSSGVGTGRIATIRSPAPEVETDFRAALRAVKKNLILMDEFVFAPERNKS